MKDHKDFHLWAEGIYNSMNDAQRATPSPYLLTQVLHKKQFERNGIWETISYWITKPAVAFSILFLVIALNVVLISGAAGNVSKRAESNNNDLFTTSITSVYDVDNVTP